ncbi:MAG: type II toxin-antitoxin system RelE/ParE family toxin [Chitinophagaceae bacterium]|nr:type II toxin-antitoxin system RelE/ParE family toxin [Chitinophagaceae bacterium]
MEIYFNNSNLEKLYEGLPVTGKLRYNKEVIEKFRIKVEILKNAENTNELRTIRSLNFEALKGGKKGLYSIRVDLKYRLEFVIEKNKIQLSEIIFIEDLSNHYR